MLATLCSFLYRVSQRHIFPTVCAIKSRGQQYLQLLPTPKIGQGAERAGVSVIMRDRLDGGR
jgi:hypothetical protein